LYTEQTFGIMRSRNHKRGEVFMSFQYQVAHVQMGELIAMPMFQQVQQSGTFTIVVEGKEVGEVDICKHEEYSHVSVQLVDTFLTIEQMINFMNHLKKEFGLPSDQRISIQQL
jgi:hypothetical protein